MSEAALIAAVRDSLAARGERNRRGCGVPEQPCQLPATIHSGEWLPEVSRGAGGQRGNSHPLPHRSHVRILNNQLLWDPVSCVDRSDVDTYIGVRPSVEGLLLTRLRTVNT